MAELLAKWLNEEVVLSQPISDFERDFASGYLFGELLYKFNQQENFADFSEKDNISSKVQNFEKLEPTLRNLNIKFDSCLVDRIMKQERGYALRLLYQVKMILEKVYPPTDIAILRKTGKVGDNQPALKIGASKDQYNKMQSTFFKTRLQALNKPQKAMNIESHLRQFKNEAQRQGDEAQRYEMNEKDEKERVKQEIRRAQINKLQRNAGFMEEWLQKGVEDWKQNMAYKKEREQAQLEFEYSQAQQFNHVTMAKIDDATREVTDGIAAFEETLRNKGINPRVTKEFAEQTLAQSFNPTASPLKAQKTQKAAKGLLQKPTMGLGGTMTKKGGITLASVGLRSQAKKPLDDKARKERERRRMRMVTDQMTHLTDIEQARRQAEVLERMKRQSKQEEELQYEGWRTNQCKSVIVENRKLREAKYDKRHDLDVQNAVFKEKQMLDSMQEQMNREIETLAQRDNFLREKDREAKKLRQTVEAKKMMDAIFDIADEAFNHQQKQDADSIDFRNWHEWLQLFVQGTPICASKEEIVVPEVTVEDEEKVEEVGEMEGETNAKSVMETTASSSIQNLEHLELLDYLQNKGQWPTTLVSENKPNIELLLNGPGDQAPVTGGKGKASAKAVEAVTLEEGDADVPDTPPNNYYVGDAIEQIININFEARGKSLRPENPHYLSLKLCFVGYAFAGKRLQAMRLKEKYGLETYSLSDLVEEAIKFYQENPNPIVKENDMEESPIKESVIEESKEEMEEQNQDEPPAEQNKAAAEPANQAAEPPKPAGLGQNPLFVKSKAVLNETVEVNSEASELAEEVNAQEDMRVCGQRIHECLFNGEEIPDQLYVDLYVAKLRLTYAYKDKATLKSDLQADAARELELTRLITTLENEAQEMQDPDSGYRRKKNRTVEVVQDEITMHQQELEDLKQIQRNGWILIDFPSNFGQAMLLERALSGYQIKEDLEKTQRETEQEEANMLVRPTERPAPPKTLIPSGIDAIVWFDCSRDECLRRALGRRIDSQSNVIYHIQDNPPSIEKSPLCEIVEPIDDESESTACLVDRWVAFDQTSDGLQKWITLFGDEENSSNLMARIEAGGDINAVFEQIDAVVEQIIEQKMRKLAFKRAQLTSQLLRDEERLEAKRAEEAEEERLAAGEEAVAEPEKSPAMTSRSVQKSVQSAGKGGHQTSVLSAASSAGFLPDRNNIEAEFKGTLMKLWKEVSGNFKSQMKALMKKQRLQREDIQQHLYTVQVQFLNFLKRLDDKQQVLDKFVLDFNKFSDECPDMREDGQTKEELHQRCDILSDELWEIAEDRKEHAVEERKKIMESGWVEYQLEYFTSCAQQMMQSEIDKFKGTIQLIHDYYHAVEEKVVPEAPIEMTVDLLKQIEGELPEVEKLAEGADAADIGHYNYPRLEDFFKRAIKAQTVPDVLHTLAADAGKKAPAKGKDAKGKGAAHAEEDKPKLDSIYVIEMKEAIKVEKSILRYRLCQVRNWALQRLKHQRERALKVYKKLDDWISVSNKAENDAIEEVCTVIKAAIEGESKIQVELKINFMDFIVDQQIFNFIDPPPEKLPAMENVNVDKFSIPQLRDLLQELQTLADSNGEIKNRRLVELLSHKNHNSKSLNDQGGLPKSWNSCNKLHYEKMVRNLDPENTGSVDYRLLATCCILLLSDLPTTQQLEELSHKHLGGKAEVSLETFLGISSVWFQNEEVSKDREYSHSFPRINQIKHLLFDLLSKDGTLSTKLLSHYLRPSRLTSFASAKTYKDLLVADLRP